MGNWWRITKLEIGLAFRDRDAVIWSLIAPIAMAWIFGTLFKDSPPSPTAVSVERGNNPAYVEQIFSGLLKKKELVITTNENVARVVIPDSLIDKLLAGEGVDITVLQQKTSDTRAQSVSAKVREILYTLGFRAKSTWLTDPPGDEEIATLVESTGPILLESKQLGKKPRAVTGTVHQLPAMLVMFLMFQLMTFFLSLWIEDIKKGKIKRIVMSPTTMRDLFTAQLVSRLLWGLLQVVVILGVGSLILGVRLDIPYHYFAIMLLAYMVTAISLGLLVGTFFRTGEKAEAVGVLLGLLLAALGGCWWPLEVVSEPMRAVAMFIPTGVMMDATEEFIALGQEAAFPTLNLTILIVMSAVMMPLAIRRMKKQIMA